MEISPYDMILEENDAAVWVEREHFYISGTKVLFNDLKYFLLIVSGNMTGH